MNNEKVAAAVADERHDVASADDCEVMQQYDADANDAVAVTCEDNEEAATPTSAAVHGDDNTHTSNEAHDDEEEEKPMTELLVAQLQPSQHPTQPQTAQQRATTAATTAATSAAGAHAGATAAAAQHTATTTTSPAHVIARRVTTLSRTTAAAAALAADKVAAAAAGAAQQQQQARHEPRTIRQPGQYNMDEGNGSSSKNSSDSVTPSQRQQQRTRVSARPAAQRPLAKATPQYKRALRASPSKGAPATTTTTATKAAAEEQQEQQQQQQQHVETGDKEVATAACHAQPHHGSSGGQCVRTRAVDPAVQRLREHERVLRLDDVAVVELRRQCEVLLQQQQQQQQQTTTAVVATAAPPCARRHATAPTHAQSDLSSLALFGAAESVPLLPRVLEAPLVFWYERAFAQLSPALREHLVTQLTHSKDRAEVLDYVKRRIALYEQQQQHKATSTYTYSVHATPSQRAAQQQQQAVGATLPPSTTTATTVTTAAAAAEHTRRSAPRSSMSRGRSPSKNGSSSGNNNNKSSVAASPTAAAAAPAPVLMPEPLFGGYRRSPAAAATVSRRRRASVLPCPERAAMYNPIEHFRAAFATEVRAVFFEDCVRACAAARARQQQQHRHRRQTQRALRDADAQEATDAAAAAAAAVVVVDDKEVTASRSATVSAAAVHKRDVRTLRALLQRMQLVSSAEAAAKHAEQLAALMLYWLPTHIADDGEGDKEAAAHVAATSTAQAEQQQQEGGEEAEVTSDKAHADVAAAQAAGAVTVSDAPSYTPEQTTGGSSGSEDVSGAPYTNAYALQQDEANVLVGVSS